MIEEIKKQVNDLLSQDNSGHNMDHINRVLQLSLDFAQKEKANVMLVSLIALLHDVDDYKLFGEDNSDNLYNAKSFMNNAKVDKKMQDIVLSEIKSLGFSKISKGIKPKTIEGKIVADADLCDALGANGVLRVYAYGAKVQRPFFVKEIFPDENIALEKDTQSTICHIFEKHLKIKGLVMTESGKNEVKSRHQFIVDFLYHFFEEENAPEWTEYLTEYLNKYN